MTCNLCNTPLRHAEDTYCKSCVGAVELLLIGEKGRDIWEEQCIMYRGSYEGNVNSLMGRFIDEHSNKPFKLQIEELLSYLKEEIVLRLKFYKKDDLFIVFLTIKEFIRKKMITEESDWLYSSDINTINLLMSFASEIDDYEENRIGDLEKSYCNFSNAFILARHLNMVKENLNFMQELKISKIEEIVFKPCETPKSEAYFANYLEDGVNEKFEDYLLSDEYLKKN